MKREQLTNVITESIDQRCADLAHDAMQYCRWIVTAKHENQLILRKCVTGQIVAEHANAIVSLRSQQVTP